MLLRKGMWVIFERRIGILVAFDQAAGEVHLVNAAGETVEVVPARLGELEQAGYADIPKPRRPPKAFAAHLGYA